MLLQGVQRSVELSLDPVFNLFGAVAFALGNGKDGTALLGAYPCDRKLLLN